MKIRTQAGAAALFLFAVAPAAADVLPGPTAGQKSVIVRAGIVLPQGDMKASLKSGYLVGLAWRSQFSEIMGLEGELGWQMNSRLSTEGSIHLLGPQTLAVRIQIPLPVVVPFALAGGGIFLPIASFDQFEVGWNAGVLLGGGVEIYLGKATSLGADVQYRRFFESGGQNLSEIQAALRVGFHY